MSNHTEQYQLDDQLAAIRAKNDTDLVDTMIKIAGIFEVSVREMRSNRGEIENDLMMYRDEILKRILYRGQL